MNPKITFTLVTVCLSGFLFADTLPYNIVDTRQIRCYGNTAEIEYPKSGSAFFGQDAQYNGNQPAYKNNNDGTITDLNTGLMWTSEPGSKKTYSQALAGASNCKVGEYSDWRLPTIKELYSLILFCGTDPDPMTTSTSSEIPFIDTRYFKFQYGKPQDGDRIIDSQFASSTLYKSTTMNGNETMFGVNFADGRIKGYGIESRGPRGEKTFYALYVRENPDYGKNQFTDNKDGTITDKATGLMWMKIDSSKGMNWEQALKWAKNMEYAGYSDWRLPNAKELHSIVDYTRCPDITNSPAIDPIFETTSIKNEKGQKDYPYFWTSTSHVNQRGSAGVYIAFGRALGYMQDRRTGESSYMDVHGAGAQRCDIKSGNPSTLPKGRGPQGDVMRIYNYVRCVRGGTAEPRSDGPKVKTQRTSQFPKNGRQENMQQDQRRNNPPSGEDFIQHLDQNGDGKVSREEFDGPEEHFNHMDRDSDGFISKDEAPNGPPPNRGDQNRRR